MADATFPSQAVLETQSKTVQELITSSSQELPQKYIYKVSDLDAPPPLIDVPIIDFGLLSSTQELEKLRSALSFWGCFQLTINYLEVITNKFEDDRRASAGSDSRLVLRDLIMEFQAINHGMEPSFLEKVSEVGKQFFALPLEKKQEYCIGNASSEGYGSDMIISEEETLDWNVRLHLTTSPKDQRQLKFWPENPECFRETIHEYTTKIEKTNEILLKAMAMSLNLEENCFLNMYGEQATMIVRFNSYPPCPRPDLAIGFKPHSDGSAFTYLLQDKEVEGLQFLKDNQWYRVPIIPEALFINAGDQAEIMSNGIFKSAVHRVVTNSERERMSVIMYCIPNPDQKIEPVNGVVNEARPRLYKTVKDYTKIYFKYYHGTTRPIEAAKI